MEKTVFLLATAACLAVGVLASPVPQQPATSNDANAIECEICQFAVKEIGTLLEGGEKNIDSKVQALCDKLGPLSSICSNFIIPNLNKIIEGLENGEEDKAICAKITMCSGVEVVAEPTSNDANAIECEICQFAVKEIGTLVAGGEKNIDAKVQALCDKLGPLSSLCSNLIIPNLNKIIEGLKNGEEDKAICEKITMCSGVAAAAAVDFAPPRGECHECIEVAQFIKHNGMNLSGGALEHAVGTFCKSRPVDERMICEMVAHKSAKRIQDALKRGDSLDMACFEAHDCAATHAPRTTTMAAPAAVDAASFDECKICELVIEAVGHIAEANEKSVTDALDKVCKVLPSEVSSICHTLINEYVPEIVKYIENGENDNVVCTKARMCTARATPELLSGCSICEKVVGIVEGLLDKTTAEIEAIVDKEVCSEFGPLSGLCKDLVNEFLPKLIDYLKTHENPDEACKQIHVCHALSLAALPTVNEHADSIECTICIDLLNALGDIAGLSEQQIEAKADEACSHLGFLSSICKSLVSEYLPELVQYLKAGDDDKTVCAKVDLCSDAAPAAKPHEFFPGECTFCIKLASEIAGLIGENNATIEHKLESYCDDLPIGQSECKSLVKEYAEPLLKFLENKDNECEACQYVDICGANQCTGVAKPVALPSIGAHQVRH